MNHGPSHGLDMELEETLQEDALNLSTRIIVTQLVEVETQVLNHILLLII
jgi:hypothetical protein